jgi:hypothetical protein
VRASRSFSSRSRKAHLPTCSPKQTQFSISSFLPKPFGAPSASAPLASTSSGTKRSDGVKAKKRKVEEEDVLSSGGEEEEFKLPALPVRKMGTTAPVKQKVKKEAEVLDLSAFFLVFPSFPSLNSLPQLPTMTVFLHRRNRRHRK